VNHGREPVSQREFDAERASTGVQIGAVEKILTERIDGVKDYVKGELRSLKLWGCIALILGQTGAGLAGRALDVSTAAHGAAELARLIL
jgi:hypothetical protein